MKNIDKYREMSLAYAEGRLFDLPKKKRKNRKPKVVIVKSPAPMPYAEPYVIMLANNRTQRTKAEKWMAYLLEETLGKDSFHAEVPIGRRIADFLIPAKKLVIEVDGEYHFFRERQDGIRTKELNRKGFKVVRFTNHEVTEHAPEVKNEILRLCIGEHAVLALE